MRIDPVFYTGGLVALINALSLIVTHFINKKSASTKALKLLMQDRLDHLCNKAIAKGSITNDELKTIHHMHEAYKGLGGNGYFDAVLQALDDILIQ